MPALGGALQEAIKRGREGLKDPQAAAKSVLPSAQQKVANLVAGPPAKKPEMSADLLAGIRGGPARAGRLISWPR